MQPVPPKVEEAVDQDEVVLPRFSHLHHLQEEWLQMMQQCRDDQRLARQEEEIYAEVRRLTGAEKAAEVEVAPKEEEAVDPESPQTNPAPEISMEAMLAMGAISSLAVDPPREMSGAPPPREMDPPDVGAPEVSRGGRGGAPDVSRGGGAPDVAQAQGGGALLCR